MKRYVGNLLMKVGNWVYGRGCDLYLPTLTESEQLAKMNETLNKLGLVAKPRDYIGEYGNPAKDVEEVLRRVSRETGGGYDN
jgi:hypothetical protein